jgi:hypothetical protein
MPTDPRKVTEERKSERESKTSDWRQVSALEQIADTLECIRAELATLTQAVADAPPRNSDSSAS